MINFSSSSITHSLAQLTDYVGLNGLSYYYNQGRRIIVNQNSMYILFTFVYNHQTKINCIAKYSTNLITSASDLNAGTFDCFDWLTDA